MRCAAPSRCRLGEWGRGRAEGTAGRKFAGQGVEAVKGPSAVGAPCPGAVAVRRARRCAACGFRRGTPRCRCARANSRTGARHGPSDGNAWPSGAGRRPGPPRARVVPHQAACGRSGRPCARCVRALSGGGGRGFALARPILGRQGVAARDRAFAGTVRADALCRAPFIEKQQLQRPFPCEEERICPIRNAPAPPAEPLMALEPVDFHLGRQVPAASGTGHWKPMCPRSFGAWSGAVCGADGPGHAPPAVTAAAETYQGAGLLLIIALFGSNSRYRIGIVI